MNYKRIQRLWRDDGLKVPYRKRMKRHRWIGTAVGAMCPIRPNARCALDFQFDTTADGKTIKLLNVIDEYTRECPAVVVDRSINANLVIACLDRVASQRGMSRFVRFGNGSELIAYAIADWNRVNSVDIVLIEDWHNYNNNRPHSAHGDLTPTEFAQAVTTHHQAALA